MYAFFNVRAISITNNINMDQLQLADLDEEQSSLQDQELANQMAESSEKIRSSYILESLYRKLSQVQDESMRKSIEAEINAEQQKTQRKQEEIKLKNQQLGMEENAIELQKKKLEAIITKLEKELESVEEAEKSGIERANPKYNGLG